MVLLDVSDVLVPARMPMSFLLFLVEFEVYFTLFCPIGKADFRSNLSALAFF